MSSTSSRVGASCLAATQTRKKENNGQALSIDYNYAMITIDAALTAESAQALTRPPVTGSIFCRPVKSRDATSTPARIRRESHVGPDAVCFGPLSANSPGLHQGDGTSVHTNAVTNGIIQGRSIVSPYWLYRASTTASQTVSGWRVGDKKLAWFAFPLNSPVRAKLGISSVCRTFGATLRTSNCIAWRDTG